MHNAAEALFCPADAVDAFGLDAWIAGMLRFEAALVMAQSHAGVVAVDVALRIASACDATRFDAKAIAIEGAKNASLAIPLVAALKRQLHPSDAGFAHLGATSQDVLDTTQVMLSAPVLDQLLVDAQDLAQALLALAAEHARTPILARTLMQSASVTSFGLKCALWAASVVRAVVRIRASRAEAMRLQLGGAVGTQAQLRAACAQSTQAQALGKLVQHMAQTLGLQMSNQPWHSHRDVWVALGLDLALLAGSLGKIGLDWGLMSQFEVGELAQRDGGGSSAMPHKQNGVASLVAKGAALRAPMRAAALLAAMPQEHERAHGAWQAELAEWPSLLCSTAASTQALARAAATLVVDAPRMLSNIEAVRAHLDAQAADEWFDPNWANDAAEQTVAMLEPLKKQLDT